MIRVPEPELMDEAGQARAYAEADFSEPNQLFVDTFRARFPRFDGRSVLDLGCGPADICIRLARVLPGARVIGVDGARAMLDLARAAVDASGLAQQVQLIETRLGADSKLEGSFDAVVSNSLLHHLSDPAALWGAVWRHGVPGAPVMVMDLMRPESPEAAQAIVDEYSGDEPEVLRRDFYNSLCAAYRPDEVREQLREAGFEDMSCEAVSDRHLLVWGRRPPVQGPGSSR